MKIRKGRKEKETGFLNANTLLMEHYVYECVCVCTHVDWLVYAMSYLRRSDNSV